MAGRQLNSDPRFTLDDHHVPVIFGIYGPVEHPGPEAALGREVCGVEHHDLATDVHRVILSGDHHGLRRCPFASAPDSEQTSREPRGRGVQADIEHADGRRTPDRLRGGPDASGCARWDAARVRVTKVEGA